MLRCGLALRRGLLRNSAAHPSLATARALSASSESSTGAQTAKPPRSLAAQKLQAYAELSKFRLSSLVVVTTGAGFLCAGGPVDLGTMAAACVGTALCAGSAGALNQLLERRQDGLMFRTKQRPLPSGRVSPPEAAAFGAVTGAAGTGLLLALTNPTTAALGAANIALYAGLYTHLKPRSESNTWVGAVVGAVPPVMGWAAATGGSLAALMQPEPLSLAALLFLWQFPHFFALAWMHREDYARGGFSMVPTRDPRGSRTALLIVEYSLYLAALPLLTTAGGLTGSMFALEGVAANGYLLYLAHRFKADPSTANARKIFLCSLWLLPVLLAGFVLHNKQWDEQHQQQRQQQRLRQQQQQQQQEQLGQAEGQGEQQEQAQGAEGQGQGQGADAPRDLLGGALLRAKDALRGVCVHEVIATNNAHSANKAADHDGAAPGSSSSGGSAEAAPLPVPAAHLCAKVAVATGLQAGVGAAKSLTKSKGQEAAAAAAAGLAGSKGGEVQG